MHLLFHLNYSYDWVLGRSYLYFENSACLAGGIIQKLSRLKHTITYYCEDEEHLPLFYHCLIRLGSFVSIWVDSFEHKIISIRFSFYQTPSRISFFGLVYKRLDVSVLRVLNDVARRFFKPDKKRNKSSPFVSTLKNLVVLFIVRNLHKTQIYQKSSLDADICCTFYSSRSEHHKAQAEY